MRRASPRRRTRRIRCEGVLFHPGALNPRHGASARAQPVRPFREAFVCMSVCLYVGMFRSACRQCCLCTLSVHIVCARRLCTLSAHVVCALWLTLVDSCREGSHRTTRRRNACHLASPSCHRIPGGSRRPVFACTCCADMHCPTCAGPGLMWFACLVPCHSVLPNIIIESI